jgi:hypothetical protein
MNSSLPRTKQQRSQPAVYQLHQVQDLRFLRGNLSTAVGIVVVGKTVRVVSKVSTCARFVRSALPSFLSTELSLKGSRTDRTISSKLGLFALLPCTH